MTRAADEALIEIPWAQWCALGHAGRDWLQRLATGGERLPDGGYRVRMAGYRLPEFFAFLEARGLRRDEQGSLFL